jgi:malate dehydrogenase
MIGAAMGADKFEWPAGCYVNSGKFKNVMMAMPSVIDATGVHYTEISGTAEEMAAIEASYAHLQAMRDEVIGLGVLPPVEEWTKINPNL